jgi:hypothetical protein
MVNKNLTASEIIKKQYHGSKNFMTPHKLKVGKINKNVAFELSSGSGFTSGSRLYGVTVVSNKLGRTKAQSNLSKPFETKNDAEAYIRKLKNKMQLKRSIK